MSVEPGTGDIRMPSSPRDFPAQKGECIMRIVKEVKEILDDVKQEKKDNVDLSLLVIVPYLIATGFCVAGAAAAIQFNASIMPYAVISIALYCIGVTVNFARLKAEHPEYWEPDEDDLFEEEELRERKKKDDTCDIVIEEVIL